MTPTETAALSDWIGRNLFDDHKFVGLKKRGLWYHPNARGYTDNPDDAGRYTLEEAAKHEYLRDEPVTIHEFPPKDYTRPENAMEVLKRCAEKASIAVTNGTTGFMLSDLDKKSRYAVAPTLELAILLFAQKLFSK